MLAVLLTDAACGGGERRPAALCAGDAPVTAGQAPEERTLAADEWIRLLIPSYDRSGEVLYPVKDCTGAEVPAGAARCTRLGADEAWPLAPLGAAHVVVAPMQADWRIVWVQTQRHPNGEVSGPVALARFEGARVLVEAVGALRTGPDKVRLFLGRYAGVTLLAAEGDSCWPPPGDGSCRRTLALVPLSRERYLTPVPLTAGDGACVGPATIPLRVDGPVPGRPRARYAARSAVAYKDDGILVQEELTVTDDEAAGAPAVAVGRMTGERKISLQGARLVTSAPALVDDWLTQTDKR